MAFLTNPCRRGTQLRPLAQFSSRDGGGEGLGGGGGGGGGKGLGGGGGGGNGGQCMWLRPLAHFGGS